jgi:glycosyltransferase involved in cell wall biosynthesis
MSRPVRIAFLVVDDRFNKELPTPVFGTAPSALLRGFEELGREKIEVHVISCMPRVLPCPAKLAENIWFHGAHVPKWGFLRTLHSGCIRAVKRIVEEIRPDIIHAQGGESWCAVSGMFLPYPKILTLHGILRVIDPLVKLKPRPYWKLQTLLERIAIPRYDGLLCISKHTRKHVADLARRTWIVPNATDPRYFRIIPNPTFPPVILYVGTVYGLKNQVGFLDAIAPLAGESRFILRFCGHVDRSTEYGAKLGERIDRHDWCQEAGQLNRQQIEQELRSAAMLVLASFEENCPMVILEAMSAKVPVVASDVGGIPDLIENNVTGLLCDPHDADSMRDAVSKLLHNRALADALACQARIKAETQHSPLAVATRHLEIYQEMVAKKIEHAIAPPC